MPFDAELGRHIEMLADTYGDFLFRVCFLIVCNEADAQDAVQETFVRYLTKAPAFQNTEHEKAWLVKVASNVSKNILKSRRRQVPYDTAEWAEIGIDSRDTELFSLILDLPVKYKLVMHLYYIAGYKSAEIAQMLSISPAAVRKRLQLGRKMLKESMEWGQDT